MHEFTTVNIDHSLANHYGLFPALIIDLVLQRARLAELNPRRIDYGHKDKHNSRIRWVRIHVQTIARILSLSGDRVTRSLERLSRERMIDLLRDDLYEITHVSIRKGLYNSFPSLRICAKEQKSVH